MIVKSVLHASESYSHDRWVFRDVNVGFSRLYYIIDGEAYYEENGQTVRFKKNHLYLTPVKRNFNLYDNPHNKLYHTFAHITTSPTITHFTEIEVKEGTPLADAVALWRKYSKCENYKLITDIIQFLMSQINLHHTSENTVAIRLKQYLDELEPGAFDMSTICHEFGYSREHITRIFCAEYYETPKQYFHTRLMNLALEKLYAGEQIKEISYQLKFSSPYSFSKAFKKHFGSSPSQYLIVLENTNQARDPFDKP